MTVYRWARAAAALLTAALSAVAAPVPARAAPGDDDLRWSVRPCDAQGHTGRSRFEFELDPGGRVDDYVAIRNLAPRTLTFQMYTTDAFTTVDGAFALPPASRAPAAAGTWIALAQATRTLRPNQQAVVPLRLVVPATATPGDHAAGIVASVRAPGSTESGQQVMVDRRVAARVYLRVRGEVRPQARIDQVRVDYGNPLVPFARGPMTVTYRVSNTGNVRISGVVRLRARGLFGIPLSGTGRQQLPELLPGAEATFTARLGAVVPAASVSAQVDVAASTGATGLPVLRGTRSIWVVPWTLMYALLLAGAGAGYLWWRRRRRRLARVAPVSWPDR